MPTPIMNMTMPDSHTSVNGSGNPIARASPNRTRAPATADAVAATKMGVMDNGRPGTRKLCSIPSAGA
ncbi:hypothetical protein ON010_g13547 [Phytophthora cinnamomi]|nr:hypothetical protein ON010_g13547 [Phytophthora cinnamomi]